MSKKIIKVGNEDWGPIAWNLIHNFSIHSKDNELMIVMIKTFGYILPCPTCKNHYNYLINDIYKLNDDENLNKKYLIKYLYTIHNLVNETLDKNTKISFKESINIHKKTNQSKIIYFIVLIYKNLNYISMSIHDYDKIYCFFISFLNNYPSSELNEKFKIIMNSESFQTIKSPLSFRKWFLKEFMNIDYIDKNYKKYDKIMLNKLKEKQ